MFNSKLYLSRHDGTEQKKALPSSNPIRNPSPDFLTTNERIKSTLSPSNNTKLM